MKITFRQSIISEVRIGIVVSTVINTLMTLLLAVAWTSRNIDNELSRLGGQLAPELAGALNVDNTVTIVARLQGLVQRKPVSAARVVGPDLNLSAAGPGYRETGSGIRFVARTFHIPTAQSVNGEYSLVIVADRLTYLPEIALAMSVIFCLGLLTYLILVKYVSAAAHKIGAPIAELSAHLEKDGLVAAIDGHGSMKIAEVSIMMKALRGAQSRLFEVQDKVREAEVNKSRYLLATQVAHDIRSPLAALDGVLSDVSQMPDGKLSLIRMATGRIRDIANDLLETGRGTKTDAARTTAPAACRLADLIEPLIVEKRLQYRAKPEIEIEARLDAGSRELSASVDAVEFTRVLSNVVNNAVEALGDGPGKVLATLSSIDGELVVAVEDDGKGIPPEILSRIGRRGETHGKDGGSGLGLHHAKTSVESWGGKFEIQSKVGEGTRVLLRLPAATSGAAADAVILIDDDKLVQMVWRLAAKSSGKTLTVFASPKEFSASESGLSRETVIYVDSDLGEGVRGEDFAKQLHDRGFANLYLATGRPPDSLPPMPWIKGIIGKAAPWA